MILIEKNHKNLTKNSSKIYYYKATISHLFSDKINAYKILLEVLLEKECIDKNKEYGKTCN